MTMTQKKKSSPIIIKKYANRRLYNTDTSSYVTLQDLCDLVKQGSEFEVVDAKSGEDLTRSVLTQIIFEQEAKGTNNLLPINFLRQIIGYYDNNVGGLVPNYLESSMQAFAHNQEQLQEYMQKSIGLQKGWQEQMSGMFPIQQFEEMSRQNMEMFQKTLSMFTPFQAGSSEDDTKK